MQRSPDKATRRTAGPARVQSLETRRWRYASKTRLVFELRFGDSTPHRACRGDTAGDGLEQIVGVVGAGPLRAEKIGSAIARATTETTAYLLVGQDVTTNLALALLHEADVGLHALLKLRREKENDRQSG